MVSHGTQLININLVIERVLMLNIILFLTISMLELELPEVAVKLDIIVIIKHHHHREHHQHHYYLRSAVKMDILLDALLIFSWFFEGLSPSITYMGRWVLQNSDLQASASALFQ